MKTIVLVPLVLVGLLLALGAGIYGKANAINNKSVDLQSQLSAQYSDNQNYLSSYVSGFYEQTGLAAAKSDQMDRILTDAVKGRYEGRDSAAADGTGQMFSAMVEAYPDLAGLDIYDKIATYVQSGREGYRQQQSKLLDMLRAFDKWRNTGLINKQLIKMMGVPGKDLRAQIGDDVVTGEKALDRMYRIVLASSAKQAYETGVQEPLTVTPAAPAPAAPAAPAATQEAAAPAA